MLTNDHFCFLFSLPSPVVRHTSCAAPFLASVFVAGGFLRPGVVPDSRRRAERLRPKMCDNQAHADPACLAGSTMSRKKKKKQAPGTPLGGWQRTTTTTRWPSPRRSTPTFRRELDDQTRDFCFYLMRLYRGSSATSIRWRWIPDGRQCGCFFVAGHLTQSLAYCFPV